MTVGKQPISTTISGVLCLDKPLGLSSNAALGQAKRLFGCRKVGHTGTLDPLASGLLPLCFGEATKFSADLLNADKTYETTLQLGLQTTTGDAEGEICGRSDQRVTQAQIDLVLPRFRGAITQVPPLYSALKHQGKAWYEYARAGIEIERQARAITIHALQQLAFDEVAQTLTLHVVCSKGTYIRTLGEDIGTALGCGAHLRSLRRVAVANWQVAQAITLSQLEALPLAQRLTCLAPLDALLQGLPRIDLPAVLALRFQQGQRLALRSAAELMPVWQAVFAELPQNGGLVRVYDPTGNLLGTAELAQSGRLQPQRLVKTGA